MKLTPKRIAIGGASFFVFFATIGAVFGPPEEPKTVEVIREVQSPPQIIYRDKIVEVPVEVQVPAKQAAPPAPQPVVTQAAQLPPSCLALLDRLASADISGPEIGEQVGKILPVLSAAARDIVAEDVAKLNQHVADIREIKFRLGTEQIALAEEQRLLTNAHDSCRKELKK